ncbi:MAG: transposase [Acidimicrobiales bacterium]
MTLGLAERQGDLLDDLKRFCDTTLREDSIYALLHRERDHLFPDEFFADLFSTRGRASVPPSVVSVVMVLQRLEGLSDREAVERYTFDARWRYAAGVGGYDTGGRDSFVHTVLVDMRERLRRSTDRDRIFRVSATVAGAAGLVGRKRVLDSTPLYDAVATMDTITLVRSGIRGLLRVADEDLAAALRGVIRSGDDYASSAKPQIDWDDAASREALIDSRAKDGFRCLGVLDGKEDLSEAVIEAGVLLARVLGQDLELAADGVFRIARKVAPDRVISTVDPEARHGRKTSAHAFDGYRGHAAVDPDSEIITDAIVTPGNVGDASVAKDLISDLLDDDEPATDTATTDVSDTGNSDADNATTDATEIDNEATDISKTDDINETNNSDADRSETDHAVTDSTDTDASDTDASDTANNTADTSGPAEGAEAETDVGDSRAKVYGDAAYGTGELQSVLEQAGIDSGLKTQAPHGSGGLFTKDAFRIDLVADTVTCPAGVAVEIRRHRDGSGTAYFGPACITCPERAHCTTAAAGRTISVSAYEEALSRARERCADPDWQADYRATRPKVERKLAHLVRRRHGGRRARVRGTAKVNADFLLLAAAANLARLARLGLFYGAAGWAATSP